MKRNNLFALLLSVFGSIGGAVAQTNWQAKLQRELPLLGHRNWIVIVDSAYPLQTSAGIETIETNTGELEVLQTVLSQLNHAPHVDPILYTDRELQFLEEQEAPGVSAYRNDLKKTLKGKEVSPRPHLDLIHTLAETGQAFHVLVLKTTATIPYSSIFLQLDCKYWKPSQEEKLQAKMQKATAATTQKH